MITVYVTQVLSFENFLSVFCQLFVDSEDTKVGKISYCLKISRF